MKAVCLACALLVAAESPGAAATLNFTGVALSTCALTAPVEGTIALQGDLKSWATVTPASITAVNTAPATLTVTGPTSWASAPAGSPANTTFAISGGMSGVNNGALAGDAARRTGSLANIGVTVVSVSLLASAESPFVAGPHVAQATVTCVVP